MSLLKALSLFIFAWQICAYHPNQGCERALYTLPWKPGSDLLVCNFHSNSVWFGLLVHGFFLMIEVYATALAVMVGEVSEPLRTCVGSFSRGRGERFRGLCRNKDVHFLLILLGPCHSGHTSQCYSTSHTTQYSSVYWVVSPPRPWTSCDQSLCNLFCLHTPNAYALNRVSFTDVLSECLHARMPPYLGSFLACFVSLWAAHLGEDFIFLLLQADRKSFLTPVVLSWQWCDSKLFC